MELCNLYAIKANGKTVVICPTHSDMLGQPSRDRGFCKDAREAIANRNGLDLPVKSLTGGN